MTPPIDLAACRLRKALTGSVREVAGPTCSAQEANAVRETAGFDDATWRRWCLRHGLLVVGPPGEEFAVLPDDGDDGEEWE